METKRNENSTDFEEYRRQMHPNEGESREVVPTPKRSMAIAFGIFMIILYAGMGILLIINFFNWTTMAWARYVVGIVLIIYAIYRAYRYIANADYYKNKE